MQDDVLRLYTNPKGWTLLLVILASEECYEVRVYNPATYTCLKQAFSWTAHTRGEAFAAAQKLADEIQEGLVLPGLVVPLHGHRG